MYNFGVRVVKEMEEAERQYLEQNIQIALSQKEIDLEDAIAVRQLKRHQPSREAVDCSQEEAHCYESADRHAELSAASSDSAGFSSGHFSSQTARDANGSAAKGAGNATQESAGGATESVKHEFRKEIELIKAQATLGFKEDDKEFKEKLEVLKEDRKDERVSKQAQEQSRLIDQRQNQPQQ